MEKIKLEKIEGIKLFKKVGLPVLPFEILDRERFAIQIETFMKKQREERFMVRTAGVIPKFHGTPSINNATLPKDKQKIEEFFKLGFTVFIMPPANIHRDFHSINVMKLDEELVIEVVGAGFTATDLTRHGHAHEEIVLGPKTLEVISRRTLISPERYKLAVEKKMNEIGMTELRKERSYLLKYKEYIPLSSEELDYTKSIVPKMEKVAKGLKTKNYVASISFVDLGNGKDEPVIWDLYGMK